MAEQEVTWRPNWPLCGSSGCFGVRRADQEGCLAHLGSEARGTLLAALKPGADLDLRGTPLDRELLSQLLAAVRPKDGPPTLGNARFDRAQFNGNADFRDTHFTGAVSFREAQFAGDARFIQAQFNGDVGFRDAQFSSAAEFQDARFDDAARFSGVRFRGSAEFRGAQLSGDIEFRGAQFLRDASFEEVQFNGEARFGGVQFKGDTVFEKGRFTQDAWFEEARFRKGAQFRKAQFGRDALFSKAKFTQDAVFDMAQFSQDARFSAVTFNGDAWFQTAHLSGRVSFNKAQFDGDAWFNEAQFTSGTLFDEARFSGLAQFVRTRFGGEARFWRTQFKRAGSVGPVFAGSRLVLDRTVFERDTLIQVIGATLVCTASQFAESATLRLRYAQVVLDGTVFTKPSTVAFAFEPWKGPNSKHDQGDDPGGGVEVEPFGEDLMVGTGAGRSSRPRLLSVRGVDVATLTLSELDLAGCLFQGAHHLDQLRIEGARPFADTPAAWRLQLGNWWIPVWRPWSRRQTLAEEHHCRRECPSPAVPGRWSRLVQPAWHGPACQTPSLVQKSTGQQVQRLFPDRLAVLYRALRKAQEDSKNEPGAADFYYGEMEMRRRDEHTSWAERLILRLYWLVAGYGLRGLRSLVCLLAVVVGLAGLLQAIGFNGVEPTFGDSLVYAAHSMISIVSSNSALTGQVSWAGEVLRIVLRLIGPVLLGLALLSVRNRVKR